VHACGSNGRLPSYRCVQRCRHGRACRVTRPMTSLRPPLPSCGPGWTQPPTTSAPCCMPVRESIVTAGPDQYVICTCLNKSYLSAKSSPQCQDRAFSHHGHHASSSQYSVLRGRPERLRVIESRVCYASAAPGARAGMSAPSPAFNISATWSLSIANATHRDAAAPRARGPAVSVCCIR